jgi:hypothetical protein
VLCLLTGALRCQSSVLELKQPKEVKSFQNELTLLNVGGEKSGKFYVHMLPSSYRVISVNSNSQTRV